MNIGAAVLTFREGLEAALILAIMLGYLRKVGRLNIQWSVWAGALTAALLAVGFTLVLQLVGAQFEDPAKAIYEGLTSLLAVAMLTAMILWMARQARYIKGSLEHSMKERLATGAVWGLFALAFMTVAREGVETALFLSASAFQSSGADTLVGGIVGLVVAAVVAWAVYVAGVRLQLRTFFKVTSVLLVIFAAGILRYAIHEFEEIGWLPAIIEHVWNTDAWISSDGVLGSILQALVGYTPSPSLLQLIGYFGYLLIVGWPVLRPVRTGAAPVPAVQQPSTVSAAVTSAAAGSAEAQAVPAGAHRAEPVQADGAASRPERN
jgi:high-affinity iron transporter